MNRMIRGAICLLLAVSVTPAIAQAQKSGSRVWVAMSYVSPLSESDQNVGGVTEAVKASDEMGWQLGAEFRSGMLGLAVDYMKSKHDLSASAAGLLGNTEFSPISGSLLWHLPGGQLDFYGGPTASWVNWSDLELSTGGSLKLDGTFAYGLTVGAELPLSTGLAVGGSLRWLNLDAKASDTDETVSVDPLISNLSLSFRF